MRVCKVIWLGLFLSVLPAHAQTQGVLIRGKETRNGQTTNVEIRLARTHFRVDHGAPGDRMVTIFDAAKAISYDVNLTRNAYLEVSKTEMDRMLADTLRLTLPNPTPEQQARIDEMLRSRNAPNPAATRVQEFFPFSSGKVGEWPCKNYAPPGGAILCAADLALFGLIADDFEVLRQHDLFQLSLSGGAAPSAAQSRTGEQFIHGISEGKPVAAIVLKVTRASIPAYTSSFEVTEIRRETLQPGLFEIPAGATRQTLTVPGVPRRTPQ